jgi:hypothetical protein
VVLTGELLVGEVIASIIEHIPEFGNRLVGALGCLAARLSAASYEAFSSAVNGQHRLPPRSVRSDAPMLHHAARSGAVMRWSRQAPGSADRSVRLASPPKFVALDRTEVHLADDVRLGVPPQQDTVAVRRTTRSSEAGSNPRSDRMSTVACRAAFGQSVLHSDTGCGPCCAPRFSGGASFADRIRAVGRNVSPVLQQAQRVP